MTKAPDRRRRRTLQETFLDTLDRLSKGNRRAVSNDTLLRELTWKKPRYDGVKVELIKQEIVVQGPGGGGGTLRRNNAAGSKPLKIFISYSHADKADRNDLVKHLEPLKKLGLVSHWDDQEIKAGERFEATIFNQLKVADIVLLLISIDFINSDYCYNKEMVGALENERLGSARVIPILLRDCIWRYTPFKGLQMVAGAKPIANWPSRDAAFTAIVEDIKEAVEDVTKQKRAD